MLPRDPEAEGLVRSLQDAWTSISEQCSVAQDCRARFEADPALCARALRGFCGATASFRQVVDVRIALHADPVPDDVVSTVVAQAQQRRKWKKQRADMFKSAVFTLLQHHHPRVTVTTAPPSQNFIVELLKGVSKQEEKCEDEDLWLQVAERVVAVVAKAGNHRLPNVRDAAAVAADFAATVKGWEQKCSFNTFVDSEAVTSGDRARPDADNTFEFSRGDEEKAQFLANIERIKVRHCWCMSSHGFHR